MAAPPAKFASENVGAQVKKARTNRGWDQEDLAARLTELGFGQAWRQTKISKIEKGAVARLSLDDVLALAAALGVQVAHLLAPDGADIAIAPKIKRNPADFRNWLRGEKPLADEDERNFFFGAIVPDSEWKRWLGRTGLVADEATGPTVIDVTDALERIRKEDEDAR